MKSSLARATTGMTPNEMAPSKMALPCSSVAGNDKLEKSDLMELGDQFRRLRDQLNEIVGPAAQSQQAAQAHQATQSYQFDADLEEQEDVIRAQLYELAWQIADTKAETIAGLKLKAWIISDRCGEDHSDIIAALAQSISRDISSMPG